MVEGTELFKKIAAEKAVDYIKDGMTIGLGSGSTIYWMIKKLSERVQQGLKIKGIPTSRRTEIWAREAGIPLTSFAEIKELDLAIDGADEVDPNFHLTKGGGGSLVREKIVDVSSKQFIVVVDQSKLVNTLGAFPLPVEVVPFGCEATAEKLTALHVKPILRMKDNEIFISDNGNYILDCQFNSISNPKALHEQIKRLVGVVETGLFVGMANKIIVGGENGVEVLEK
ncbi:ribose-5-phosphate isomerase RpiA [Halalkalibacterium ligniniphilum]|uniref:ribose-5-phosphate isomerase RpiA n=1 Tax=Halalkalibacterium ligniniphilum TaxID=1134413 RepID=UPI000346CE87|nr:ribose-5-phosphate isomerase RpiA [Halalkalibacterium ligniniphilum]